MWVRSGEEDRKKREKKNIVEESDCGLIWDIIWAFTRFRILTAALLKIQVSRDFTLHTGRCGYRPSCRRG